MPGRYVIFDLDETLVHSDAVRAAFATVADARGLDRDAVDRLLDDAPGRTAAEIFAAAGLGTRDAEAAQREFVAALDELNERLPAVPYPDADETLRALAAEGSTLLLSTGSSAHRAEHVLADAGWHVFATVVGSGRGARKDAAHYARMAAATEDPSWTLRAATVGDRPEDMRLGAAHDVPVRIGVDRRGDARRLIEAGATHVVTRLADVLPIVRGIPA